MLNKAIVQGRLVRDPDFKFTQASSTAVASFTLAVERNFTPKGQDKQTDFLDIVVWGKTAEFVRNYFSKGMMAIVVGSIQTRKWEDKNGNKRVNVEIVASEVNFGEFRKTQQNDTDPDDRSDGGFTEVSDDDGEVPF